jgi:hypothetical protein
VVCVRVLDISSPPPPWRSTPSRRAYLATGWPSCPSLNPSIQKINLPSLTLPLVFSSLSSPLQIIPALIHPSALIPHSRSHSRSHSPRHRIHPPRRADSSPSSSTTCDLAPSPTERAPFSRGLAYPRITTSSIPYKQLRNGVIFPVAWAFGTDRLSEGYAALPVAVLDGGRGVVGCR